ADVGPAEVSKSVVVVGGGPAGMEAARVAAERGHQVVLFEKSARLGGQVNLVMKTPKRDTFEEIILFFERQLPKLGVDVRMNTEATAETVLAESPDAVIVATGSIPYFPDIPNGEGGNIISLWDVMKGAEVGDRVVMIDTQGTPDGPTVADYLASQGKQVEIVTGLKYVGTDITPPIWHHLYEELLRKDVKMTPMTGVSRIGEDFVEVYHVVYPLKTWTIDSVDTVVMATGGQVNDALYQSLRGKVEELYAVGDCAQPRNIEMATYDGHRVAVEL
ncbi:MAG: FAD-dependent oxidoreductase, partial [Dehalococcoidia bacterium]